MNVVMQLSDVPVMLILFLLLSPISMHIALLALLFNLVQTATLVANQLTLIGAQLLASEQPALTDAAIAAYSSGEALGLAFFGFTLLGVGYLIRHSGYLPRLVGLLLQVGGASYVINSFLVLLSPELANILLLVPAFVAELSLALWMLLKGVDGRKWELRMGHADVPWAGSSSDAVKPLRARRLPWRPLHRGEPSARRSRYET